MNSGKKRAVLSIRKSCGVSPDMMKYLPVMAAEAAGISLLFAYLFYDSLWMAAFLVPMGFAVAREQGKELRDRQRQKQKEEFREALVLIGDGLSAGYSIENAWQNGCVELKRSLGVNSRLIRQMEQVSRRLAMNEPMEKLIDVFAQESGLEEAAELSEVFRFAKRTGGNMNRIIRRFAAQITEKTDTEREILTVTSAKRLEQKIMSVMPAGILAYLRLGSPGYLDILYHNPAGIAVMTVSLVVYAGAYMVSERMIAIEV